MNMPTNAHLNPLPAQLPPVAELHNTHQEHAFALQVRRHLDASSERLSYKITHRLEAARLAAVRGSAAPQSGAARVSSMALAARTPSRWMQVAGAALPAIALVVGLYGIGNWKEDNEVADVELVNTALMADDDLPVAAYADHGFGVYLKNNSQGLQCNEKNRC